MRRLMKETPIGNLAAERIGDDDRFNPGFCIDLWGAEKTFPKHLQPICRIEYVEAKNAIRVSVFADGDENAPVSVTDIPFNENLIGVVYKGYGVLEDKAGNRYLCDGDSAGFGKYITKEKTGELLQAYARNSHGIPTSIGPVKDSNE